MPRLELDRGAAERCRTVGVDITDAQWRALPQAAQQRLAVLPCGTDLEKRSLAELARWLLATFPPGWREKTG